MVLLVISSCAPNLRGKAAQLEVGLGRILHQGDPRRPLCPLAGQELGPRRFGLRES
jgi:hypothetical protein